MTNAQEPCDRDVQDTVAFVQEWMMSGDHEADQWHRDFAAAIDARSTPPSADAAIVEAQGPVALEYKRMGSSGRCDWTNLREAVSEAVNGARENSPPFDPSFYPGHQIVPQINYNSLDRIVTAFVETALDFASRQPARDHRDKTVEILSRALAWHGDPQRMATTREEWQQTVDDAITWVKANPEPDRLSFSSFASRQPVGVDYERLAQDEDRKQKHAYENGHPWKQHRYAAQVLRALTAAAPATDEGKNFDD